MTYSPKKIFTITYPVLISLLVEHLIGITDTAFMGRVGEVELGASAIAGIYYMVLYMIGFGFSIGAEILMARRNGERQYKTIGNIFFQGIAMLYMIAAGIIIISMTFSSTILRYVISSPDIYAATASYAQWRVYGLFFAFTICMFRAFYMATTQTKILTLNSIIMVASNIILNYILVFGKLGFPAMGIAGAAIGSSISELISVLFFVIYTWRRSDRHKYGLFRVTRLSNIIQRQIIKVSGWTTVQYFLSTGTWLFFFLAIEHLGERPLAVSNIVRNISAIFFMLISAFSSTGTAIISNLMGSGRQKEVMPVCLRIIKMCAVIVIPVLIFAAAFPRTIMHIFTNNPELIESAVPAMMIMLFGCIINVPAQILFFAISGTGNTKKAFYIEIAALIVYTSYVFYLTIGLKADIALCWTSEWVYSLVLLVSSYIYFKRSSWDSKQI